MGQSASSLGSLSEFTVGRDYTADLPDGFLADIFDLLGTGDLKSCSLVCHRWLNVIRSRNSLSVTVGTGDEIIFCSPSILPESPTVRRFLGSINTETLVLYYRGRNYDSKLTSVTCNGLTKLSCGSCTIGAKTLNAVLDHCAALRELSVERLRGEHDSAEPIGPGAAASSLKSIRLKDLDHGQNFGPLIVGSKKLKTLKLIRCSGEWDEVLVMLGKSNTGLTEIHLVRVQVSDVGLCVISNFSNLEILHIVKTPECSNSGLVCVAEHCKLLRKLHIDAWRTNRIGDEGLIAVAKQCPNLQELVLIGMNPTLTSLAPIASNCQKLERLALCKGGAVGVAEIASIVAKCAALKKLCVWDERTEALDFDSPHLVKVKVKKCKGVSSEVADWLRNRKGSLFVILDACEIGPLDGSGSELGVQESGMEFLPIASSSNSRMTRFRTEFGFFTDMNSLACTLRRCYNGEDDGSNSNLC